MERVRYELRDQTALISLNRPEYRNAQSWPLLDELDAAFERAVADDTVRVIVVTGVGDHFSSGHDLGTPEQQAARSGVQGQDARLAQYEAFRRYNLELTLKWRNLPKPTIAMVRGYCIYGGWMVAAAMDLVFASETARFLAGLVEYFSVPWDVGARAAKELLFESRFIDAREAHHLGFVSRVYADSELERETLAYAARVAENPPWYLRMAKLAVNRAEDIAGFTAAVEAAFHDYLVASPLREREGERDGPRRLPGVELALRGMRGDRPGLQRPR